MDVMKIEFLIIKLFGKNQKHKNILQVIFIFLKIIKRKLNKLSFNVVKSQRW